MWQLSSYARCNKIHKKENYYKPAVENFVVGSRQFRIVGCKHKWAFVQDSKQRKIICGRQSSKIGYGSEPVVKAKTLRIIHTDTVVAGGAHLKTFHYLSVVLTKGYQLKIFRQHLQGQDEREHRGDDLFDTESIKYYLQ